MSTTGPPFRIDPPSMGQRADLDYHNMPSNAAKRLRNWVFRDGRFIVRSGFQLFADNVGQRPMAFRRYMHSGGTEMLVMATAEGWHHYGSDAWTNITGVGNPLTGSQTDHCILRVFYKGGTSYLIGTNGKDAPKKWDGAAAGYSDWAGAPPVAKCLEVAFDRVLLGNTANNGPIAVDVSSINDFEAGYGSFVTLLDDTPGPIVCMGSLGGQQTAIYKEDAVCIATAQGALDPFSFEFKATNIKGPASAQLVVPLEDGLHAWMAKDGTVQIFDREYVSEFSRPARAHILQTYNENRTGRAFGFYDSRQEEIWFIYPPLGEDEPGMAVIVNKSEATTFPIVWGSLIPTAGSAGQIDTGPVIGDYKNEPTTLGDIDLTIGEMGYASFEVLLGDKTGQCYEQRGNDDDGVAIEAELVSGFAVFPEEHDPRLYVDVNRVEHLFEGPEALQDVTITLGASNDGKDPIFDDAETIDIAEEGPLVTEHNQTGKQLAMKIEASGTTGVNWRGSFADIKVRGPR